MNDVIDACRCKNRHYYALLWFTREFQIRNWGSCWPYTEISIQWQIDFDCDKLSIISRFTINKLVYSGPLLVHKILKLLFLVFKHITKRRRIKFNGEFQGVLSRSKNVLYPESFGLINLQLIGWLLSEAYLKNPYLEHFGNIMERRLRTKNPKSRGSDDVIHRWFCYNLWKSVCVSFTSVKINKDETYKWSWKAM